MQKTFFILGIVAALLGAVPHTTFAYRTSDTTAVRVTDTHVLFSIPFTAGFLNRTSLTPLMASTDAQTRNAVIVSIKDKAGTTISVPVRAVVLGSDLARVRGYYIVPEGKRGTFRLIAVAEIPKGTTEYHLTVDTLPYLLIDNQKVMTATAVATPFIETFVTPAVR
jgi:hypothetical protein